MKCLITSATRTRGLLRMKHTSSIFFNIKNFQGQKMKKAKILAERVSVDKTRAGDQRLTLTPNCINTISSTTS